MLWIYKTCYGYIEIWLDPHCVYFFESYYNVMFQTQSYPHKVWFLLDDIFLNYDNSKSPQDIN